MPRTFGSIVCLLVVLCLDSRMFYMAKWKLGVRLPVCMFGMGYGLAFA